MESISRISTLLESARDLTLDAAAAARSSRSSSKPLDRSQVKKLLDSRNEREILEGLRRVISMMYRSQKTLPFFSSVVKNVASPSLEIKKLVYIYLIHHAEQEPDLALLSINTMQKSLSDTNPQVRALALRTMSGIRVPVISQIVSLAIKKGAADMSPYVRRAAALAIPKCYSLDPAQLPQLLEYLSLLLGDRQDYVAGAAVAAFLEVCPDRIDLVHKHYRSLVKKTVDMDEWSQLAMLRLMTVYARKCFPRPRARTRGAHGGGKGRKGMSVTDDISDSDHHQDPSSMDLDLDLDLDPDLELLLSAIRPLLQSRNAAVVVGVARCYSAVGTPAYTQAAAGPLVALLRGAQDVQAMALSSIVGLCLARPRDFVPYAARFLVRAGDSQPVWEPKLELLTLVFPHAPARVKSLILAELEHFCRASADPALVREAVRAVGRCAQAAADDDSSASAAPRCLRLLLGQVAAPDGTLAAESLTVIRHLIQRDPAAHAATVVRLAKNLDAAADPLARATIVWLVGEFAVAGTGTGSGSGSGSGSGNTEDSIAPDVLRILLRDFAHESDLAKRQILLLAAKVYLHHINSRIDNKQQHQQQHQNLLNDDDEDRDGDDDEDNHPIARLWQYVLLLVRYDTSYDLRDRARLYKALLAVPQLATLVLLAPKPAPQAPSPSEMRRGYTLGSAALVLAGSGGGGGAGVGSGGVGGAGSGGLHWLRGYEPLPDWVDEAHAPDPRLRDSGEAVPSSVQAERSIDMRGSTATAGAGSMASRGASVADDGGVGVKTLDDWLAEDEGNEAEEEEESEEEEEDEEEEEEEDEEDDEDEDEDDEDDDEDDEDEDEDENEDEDDEDDDGDEKIRLIPS